MRSDGTAYLDHLVDRLAEGLDRDPCEATEAFGRHLHFGFWEDPWLAEGSAEDYARAAEKLSQLIFRAANLMDGQRILDVGCGIGGTLDCIDDRWTGMSLVGLNIDGRQLEIARRWVHRKEGPTGSNRISFHQGDACRLPFEDRSFDVVLAVECIFDFPSRREFFAEAFRVLRLGGRLVISDLVAAPALSLFLRSNRPLLRWLAPPHGRGDISFTLHAYRRLAQRTGFIGPSLRDVTLNVLPSFSFCSRTIGDLPMIPRDRRSTRLMFEAQEWASRQGLLRYLILSFRRPLEKPSLR